MNNKNYLDDEIDFVNLISILFKNKKLILKTILLFSFVGIIYSLSIKNTYRASSVFYPHYEKLDNAEGFKNLAGLAGINLNTDMSDNIPSNLYPNLLKSPIFKSEILNDTIIINEEKLTYRKYLEIKLEKEISISKILLFPINYLKKLFVNKDFNAKNNNLNIIELSNKEFELHEYLSNVITLDRNEKEGFIDLSVKDNNRHVASQIAKTSTEILQRSIIEFKIKNVNNTYQFVNSQLKIAKNNFYNLQDSLALFKDKNLNIKSDLFLNKFSRIESEFLVSKNIYNELAVNKEKIAIDVKKNTPIFTIIKPVVVPNSKDGPNRLFIIFGFSFIGFLISNIYLIFNKSFVKIWSEIKSK